MMPGPNDGRFRLISFVLVLLLAVAGNMSECSGRPTVILLNLAACLAGTPFFALGVDVRWVFLGSGFMGLGVGLS